MQIRMAMEKSPSFRRVIYPWYDATGVCFIVLALMVCVLFFGLLGMVVAGQTPAFNDFLWFPSVLSALSGFVAASLLFRLVKRHRWETPKGL